MRGTIDRKFVFTAVNPANGHYYTEKDALILCAKDRAVLPALAAYRNECQRLGTNKEHLESIDLLMDRVRDYQASVESRIPDTVPGEETRRCIDGIGVDR